MKRLFWRGFGNRVYFIVYPILSIASKVPKDMPIIPIYMKVYKKDDGIHYHIVEYEYHDPRMRITAIDELKAKKYSHLILGKKAIKIHC